MNQHKDRVVIIGWDDFARSVLEQLISAGKNIFVITNNPDHSGLIQKNFSTGNVLIHISDYKNFEEFKKLELDAASAVLVNIPGDTDKLVYVINLKMHFAGLKLVVPIDNPSLKETFTNAGVTYPLSKDEIAAKMLASYLFEKDVAVYSSDFSSTAKSETDFDIQQYRVDGNNPFIGKTCGAAFRDFREEYNAVLIGLSRYSSGTRELMKNPDDATVIQEGDYLIAIVSGTSSRLICRDFRVAGGYSE